MTLEAALEAEAESQALCMLQADFREAYDAFSEKRAPLFNRRSGSSNE
jgi:enoyl-CoA hydratase/carnithine racemase